MSWDSLFTLQLWVEQNKKVNLANNLSPRRSFNCFEIRLPTYYCGLGHDQQVHRKNLDDIICLKYWVLFKLWTLRVKWKSGVPSLHGLKTFKKLHDVFSEIIFHFLITFLIIFFTFFSQIFFLKKTILFLSDSSYCSHWFEG